MLDFVKKLLPISLFVIATVFLVSTFFVTKEASLHQKLLSIPDRSLVFVRLAEKTLTLELVHSPESVEQGLSGRASMQSINGTPMDGMLFVFPQRAKHGFWMPNMQFDLDIIWFDQETVVDVSRKVPRPAPEQSLEDLPVFIPRQNANIVLEIEAERAEELQITPGVELTLTSVQ